MNTDVSRLPEEMRGLREQLERLFDSVRETFRYRVEYGRVRLSREVQELQWRYRVSSLRYLLNADLASLFQHACLHACGVPVAARRRCMVNDRHKPAYLNVSEKVNCSYRGYANGVMACAREIISRTRKRWCPVRHARHVPDAHRRYPQFFPCSDALSRYEKLQDKRQEPVDESATREQEQLRP
jgi:hypothetical protein